MSQSIKIRIKGHLDKSWQDWLGSLSIQYDDNGETVLTGSLPDQAALHGVLNHLRDLGVQIISINSFTQLKELTPEPSLNDRKHITTMNNSPRYATVIDPVFEVTLSGTADGHIWRGYLQGENPEYQNFNDKVVITISAVDSRFKGIRFQEFSVSLKLPDNQYFLAHAFNSLALFAYAERTFFRTPYYKGTITIRRNYLRVSHGHTLCFEARLPEEAPIVSSTSECDDLIVYLPRRLRKNPDCSHYFYARLEGWTESHSVKHAMITVPSNTENQVLKLLSASQFEIHEWRVRLAARHSKSKTFHDVR